MKKEKTIGVMGGMGPDATIDFFRKLVDKTNAAIDQEHLHIIINNNPKVPDRQKSIAGSGPSSIPELQKTAKALEQAGADFLVMTCNTAHYYADEIIKAVSIPFVSILDASVKASLKRKPELKRIGILAANGTINAKVYEKHFNKAGVDCIKPGKKDQARVMDIIYRVKAKQVDTKLRQEIIELANILIDNGAEMILGGCTEIPLILQEKDITVPLINSTDALVDASLEYAREPES